QYNDFRRETLVTDARGFTTRTFFNEYGNPIEVIAPDGAVTTYEYTDPQDPYHRTAVVDALGNRTEYAYDAASNITRITLPSGNTVAYGDFTAFGQPGTVQDARGNVQLVKYDGAGNVTDEIVLAAGIGAGLDPTTYQPELHPSDVLAWTRHGYDSVGNKTSSTQVRDIANIRGLTRTWTFDAQQRYATQLQRCGDKDGDGLVADDACDTTPLVFDTLGRLTEGVNARFEPIEIHYDALNRVTRATDALGQLREYRFDANGNPVHERLTVDVNGIPTLVDSRSAEYGPADRKRLAIDAGGFATRFAYDAMGNLTATTNPDNFTVGFTHDPLGRVRSAFDEEGREARRTLD
ncbi:RHS repeat protein, partial [Halochromatium glycolicum]